MNIPSPRLATGLVMVTGILFGIACGVSAQTVDPTPNVLQSQKLATPPLTQNPSTAPAVEHLLGDWGGLRTYLNGHGIDILLDNTNEFGSNIVGGTRRSTTNAGQTALEADIDWDKLAGITGFSTHSVIIARYGANLSANFGDQLSPAQEIFGAGGNVFAHFVYTYGELSLRGGQIDIAVGRMPVGNEFAASSLYCNFMNNALCGNPKALAGQVGGFSAWPDATWGGRVRLRPTADTYLQFGIFQVNRYLYSDQAGFRSGWLLSGSGDTGVEVPVEMAWQPKFGSEGLPGNYKLGLGFDSSSYQTFGFDAAASGGAQQQYRQGRLQFWALADQMIVRNGPGANDGLILLAGYVHDDPASFVRSDEVFAGLVDHGFWRARSKDTMAALLSYQKISGRLTDVQNFEQNFNLPLTNQATGVQTREVILELTYQIHVAQGVTFAPDFQYINRPNAQANIPNAVVLGFKSHIEF